MTHRALLLIAALSLCAGTAAAGTTLSPRGMARLRPATDAARILLDDAARRSAIVRGLVEDFAETDVIVHVGFGRPEGGIAASTVFVAATEHARYLRITIDTMTSPHDVIPLLAHELEHALEIARHPDVRDTAGVRLLYLRIGRNGRAPSFFETEGAREIERRVRAETLWAPAKGRGLR